jgi:hypothetical protein
VILQQSSKIRDGSYVASLIGSGKSMFSVG